MEYCVWPENHEHKTHCAVNVHHMLLIWPLCAPNVALLYPWTWTVSSSDCKSLRDARALRMKYLHELFVSFTVFSQPAGQPLSRKEN